MRGRNTVTHKNVGSKRQAEKPNCESLEIALVHFVGKSQCKIFRHNRKPREPIERCFTHLAGLWSKRVGLLKKVSMLVTGKRRWIVSNPPTAWEFESPSNKHIGVDL